MAQQRKVPLRKCVVTNEMMPKKQLIRVVRTPEGDVQIDETGKKSGRGAYLTLAKDVVLAAQKKNTLGHHLKVQIPDALYEQLLELAEKSEA